MPATTRRTLHYYWQVTRAHFGLFAGLVASTLAYVALLSYANPYLMSMVVDQVSANPVAADEVFSTFGPFALALVAVTCSAKRRVSCRTIACTACKSQRPTTLPR